MKKYIVIVDYGLGNIRSAEQSLKNVVEENCIDYTDENKCNNFIFLVEYDQFNLWVT